MWGIYEGEKLLTRWAHRTDAVTRLPANCKIQRIPARDTTVEEFHSDLERIYKIVKRDLDP